ncbi:MAG: hypothetical protein R2727_02990 [Bacteroidales bacterium]
MGVLDGKRVSVERAIATEPLWKDISLDVGEDHSGNWENRTSEPPTLVYRVEVRRVDDPVSKEELETIRRFAGDRPMEIVGTGDGKYIYLIGKFLTFESASSYSDLLFRNGMKEARVVAYLGKREIPLEKARELFELYFSK